MGLIPIRNLIREGYKIEGGCCGDICISMFCGPCVAIQLRSEVMYQPPIGQINNKLNKIMKIQAKIIF